MFASQDEQDKAQMERMKKLINDEIVVNLPTIRDLTKEENKQIMESAMIQTCWFHHHNQPPMDRVIASLGDPIVNDTIKQMLMAAYSLGTNDTLMFSVISNEVQN